MKALDGADECLLGEYTITRKTELLKWKASIKEQLEKILPLDNLILAELAADEKVSEEEVAEEIERSGRLKADATQRLAAIEERLNEQASPTATLFTPHPSQASPSPGQSFNQPGTQQKTVRAKLPKLEVRKFSGKIGEWQEFWDSFESAIHLNDRLSNVDKFSYLRSLLMEPARSAIARICADILRTTSQR